MLKDRQEGMICLHGCALMLTSIGVFLGWAALVSWAGWIRFAPHFSLSLYLVGVLAASLWIHHGLRGARQRLGRLGWAEAAHLARQQLTRLTLVLLTLAFATKDTGMSRAFLLGYLLVMAATLVLANRWYPRVIFRLFFHNAIMRTVVVVPPEELEAIAGWMQARRHLGIEVIGWISRAAAAAAPGGLPRLGDLAELRRVVMEHDVAQVVVSQFHYERAELNAIMRCLENLGCRVLFYSNVRPHFETVPVSIDHEDEYTFVTLTSGPLENPVNRVLKRLVDVAIALPVVLCVLPPLSFAVWLMQRGQSPGPLFHRQHRSGLNRRKFLIYKFRTMHPEEGGLARQARRGDARIYPFGRFLRRSSLDEVPQFLNVLWGDMSVSGPRPHLLEHDEQFAKVVNAYYSRHFVKPGITGLAQSMGFRGEISAPALLHQRIRYDMLYIRRWTLLLDLRILVTTVRQIFVPPRSAY